MCLYLYNKYTQYTLIYYVNKNVILDVLNHLTELIVIYIQIENSYFKL